MSEKPQLIFKKPPAREVQIAVQFKNALGVADARSKYSKILKERFPLVVMPERAKLEYDFGDYSLYTENFSEHLEISMNYFRLFTTNYPGFAKFSQNFRELLSFFTECYDISTFTHFALRYNNEFPLPTGKDFRDCFAFGIEVPDSIEFASFVGRGTLIFQVTEGFVVVDVDPQVSGERVTSYLMNLAFAAQRELKITDRQDDILEVSRAAHDRLRNFFVGILKPDYLEFLGGEIR